MRELHNPHVPWWRRIGIRVGVSVALVVFLVDVLSIPLWMDYTEWLHPAWFSPDALREAAARIEETGETTWVSPEELRTLLVESIVFALILALLAAYLVSRMATRRVVRLAQEVREPPSGQDLPGPFRVEGHDEIRILAESMNAMRARITELLDRIAERDAERRRWVAQVSHDIRTPLTALSISLERATRAGSNDPEEVQGMIAAAQIDVRRVGTLAEDLLEIARLDAGDQLVLEPVPLGELVAETVAALEPLARERGLELRNEVGTGAPTLHADGRRLARALENLLMNSIQHARRRVVLGLVVEGERVRILVSDDGPGFPSDLRGAPTLRRADSAGLGLDVARRVASAHGGEVGVERAVEGGARVALVLSIGEPYAARAAADTGSRPGRG